jgi:hypothetical protein
MVVPAVITACVILGGWYCIFREVAATNNAARTHSAAVSLDRVLKEEAAPTVTETAGSTAVGDSTSHEAGDSDDGSHGPSGTGNDRPVARELLQTATTDELKGLLRSRGLRVSGLKADLIARLLRCSIRSLPCEACCSAVLYASRRSARRIPPQAMNSQREADKWVAEVLGNMNEAIRDGLDDEPRMTAITRRP